MKVVVPFTHEQLTQAFNSASERRMRAAEEAHDAVQRERKAREEMHALAVLARAYGFGELEPRATEATEADVLRDANSARTLDKEGYERFRALRERSIAQHIVAHFKRHPEPATPSEVAEAIRLETGRHLSAAAVATTKLRNPTLFISAEESEKRGAFRLRDGIDTDGPTPGEGRGG